jgi:phage terminase small subunit
MAIRNNRQLTPKETPSIIPSRKAHVAPEVLEELSACESFQSLSYKHKRFVIEYLKCYEVTRAYQQVYDCSPTAANKHGTRLVVNGGIQKAIEEVSKILTVTAEDIASAQEVKVHLTKVIRGRITDVLSWNEDGLVFTKSSEEMDPDTMLLIKRVKVTERTSAKGDWTERRTVVELQTL